MAILCDVSVVRRLMACIRWAFDAKLAFLSMVVIHWDAEPEWPVVSLYQHGSTNLFRGGFAFGVKSGQLTQLGQNNSDNSSPVPSHV